MSSFRLNADAVLDEVMTNRLIDTSGGSSLSGQIRLGNEAGLVNQADSAIAIGSQAGAFNQGTYAIAVGAQAGYTGQGTEAIAIGNLAGATGQGDYAIAIGYAAGESNQPANSIVLNASGAEVSPVTGGAFYVEPIRSLAVGAGAETLSWDSTSGEIYVNSTKTFVVHHPIDTERYLVHGCLEGPEVGVYYRGTGKIPAGQSSARVELPNYCSGFEDFTTIVTPICKGASDLDHKLGASRVDTNGFTVYGSGEFNWVAFGKRGSIDAEPLKSSKKLKGSGPYVWLE